ncbi:valine--tRNA ligase [Candidatus Tachikawaea gelatinosa]|uniref:Valine--tRNA ligase n=1 Tax=Candidatus Tachikawaea gelatinosa TaxID=1410383 RepID=A0A090AQV7_9ENTR|nr:valine--tRNA ligase [Candidatus Tachikawaea gelatinosa]BAP58732.1 valine--tRNA ligase [Candidatus Tachikawaea gelatinosa]
MKKKYSPKEIEQKIYKNWEEQGYFKPTNNSKLKNFCIVIPPPNITGHLHMGHAFQQTIMDIIIRYHRMSGHNTLWQVGTDHAGIATQIIVKNQINIDNKKKINDYSRNDFIEEVWKWKEKSSQIITNQMRRLGNSIDWTRERFTMDKNFSQSVKDVFIRLYNEKLIYKKERLINWDSKLLTAVSDLEVENKLIKGSMWYIRYFLTEKNQTTEKKNYLVVATTRPETLLGDVAIAINPKDLRYRHLIGKTAIVPIINRTIPIIADEHANIKKGTGCVKITPAHDFNDYDVSNRHNLPVIKIFTKNCSIRHVLKIYNNNYFSKKLFSKKVPYFLIGLDRFSAREKIVKKLEKQKFLEKIELHDLMIPYGDRSGSIIEPMLMNQWYLRVDALSKTAIQVVKEKKIQFFPKNYKNLYYSWMYHIKDWCISRQILWGHRIPAWYDNKGNIYVGNNEKEIRLKHCLSKDLKLNQDKDVLDTWFSSSMWTFASLGWPQEKNFLKKFHPTNVLVSGFDIIFFWIARMIMITTHIMKDVHGNPIVPFKNVYITGLIRDEYGNKMSKSKGNVIDPLDLIDGISLEDLLKKRTFNMIKPKIAKKIFENTIKKFPNGISAYGTDALRFTLTAIASNGKDINFDINRLDGYRNFCNKLWNASIFIMLNTKNYNEKQKNKKFLVIDYWILHEFNILIKNYRKALDTYRFDLAANFIYDFVWNKFCDWYLEFFKVIAKENKKEINGTQFTLITVFESLLRLAHPIIPFITEEIWQTIKNKKNLDKENTIMLQPFPKENIVYKYLKEKQQIILIQKIISTIRNIRNECKISLNTLLKVYFESCLKKDQEFIIDYKDFIIKLAKIDDLFIFSKKEKNKGNYITKTIDKNTKLFINIENFNINYEEQVILLDKKLIKVNREIAKASNILENKNFLKNAPKQIVDKKNEHLNQLIFLKNQLLEKRNMLDKTSNKI